MTLLIFRALAENFLRAGIVFFVHMDLKAFAELPTGVQGCLLVEFYSRKDSASCKCIGDEIGFKPIIRSTKHLHILNLPPSDTLVSRSHFRLIFPATQPFATSVLQSQNCLRINLQVPKGLAVIGSMLSFSNLYGGELTAYDLQNLRVGLR